MAVETISDLAVAAVQVLIERDWCRGQFSDSDGKVCLLGAINMAAYGSAEPHDDADNYGTPAVEAIAQAMYNMGITTKHEFIGGPAGALYAWNDSPHRKAVEVAAALMRVAGECKDIPVVW
jgi:hypothetical protein